MIKKFLLAIIGFYQKKISPYKGPPRCRYYPTCSQYASDAIEEWGAGIGLLLAVWRLLRCNPLWKGGIDYPPKRKKQVSSKQVSSKQVSSKNKNNSEKNNSENSENSSKTEKE